MLVTDKDFKENRDLIVVLSVTNELLSPEDKDFKENKVVLFLNKDTTRTQIMNTGKDFKENKDILTSLLHIQLYQMV